jgi:hypothetical protein
MRHFSGVARQLAKAIAVKLATDHNSIISPIGHLTVAKGGGMLFAKGVCRFYHARWPLL